MTTTETPTNILDRIRKLLALAERASTPDEADAASAKAEQMIAKYAVDIALISETREGRGKPTMRVIIIPTPYPVPKMHLLNAIAGEHNAKMIRTPASGDKNAVTLVGFESDLDLIELLFASLMIQATNAVAHARVPSNEHGKTFRQSFLMGFAGTVRERLVAARRDVMETVSSSSALVLVDRGREVDSAFREAFSRSRTTRTDSRSAAGRAAGTRAANAADLGQKRFAGSAKAIA